jgi:hypothetical protein
MNIKLITVSPQLAAKWLATNTDRNRKISKVTVNRYAGDMVRNQWQSTGEAIKFDKEGKLIDGQHRLSAVVASKKTVQMLVIRDLDDSVIQVLDTGRSRSAKDALTIAGHNGYSNELAALARKCLAHQAGTKNILTTKRIQIGGSDVTNRAIVEYCAENDLSPHITFSHRMKYQAVNAALNHGEYAFFHWMFTRISAADAESFLSKLATMEDVSADSPIRALIQKLTRSAVKLDGKMKMLAVVTAWNAFRTGEKLTTIHVGRPDAAIPQAV